MTATRQIPLSELDQAVAEVATLETLCEGLGTGMESWSSWDEALTCDDRQEAAYRECEQALDEARERLLALTGGTR